MVAFLLGGCVTAGERLVEASVGLADRQCAELLEISRQATAELDAAYSQQAEIERGQKLGAAASLVHPVGALVTMGAGLGRPDTRALRVLKDRATDQLLQRLLAKRC